MRTVEAESSKHEAASKPPALPAHHSRHDKDIVKRFRIVDGGDTRARPHGHTDTRRAMRGPLPLRPPSCAHTNWHIRCHSTYDTVFTSASIERRSRALVARLSLTPFRLVVTCNIQILRGVDFYDRAPRSRDFQKYVVTSPPQTFDPEQPSLVPRGGGLQSGLQGTGLKKHPQK